MWCDDVCAYGWVHTQRSVSPALWLRCDSVMILLLVVGVWAVRSLLLSCLTQTRECDAFLGAVGAHTHGYNPERRLLKPGGGRKCESPPCDDNEVEGFILARRDASCNRMRVVDIPSKAHMRYISCPMCEMLAAEGTWLYQNFKYAHFDCAERVVLSAASRMRFGNDNARIAPFDRTIFIERSNSKYTPEPRREYTDRGVVLVRVKFANRSLCFVRPFSRCYV